MDYSLFMAVSMVVMLERLEKRPGDSDSISTSDLC
jgi:hypothetical protein